MSMFYIKVKKKGRAWFVGVELWLDPSQLGLARSVGPFTSLIFKRQEMLSLPVVSNLLSPNGSIVIVLFSAETDHRWLMRNALRKTMTEACIQAVVEAIHSSPFQAVLYLSGGASKVLPLSLSMWVCICDEHCWPSSNRNHNEYDQVLGSLLSVPGASSTVLEAMIPYSRMSTIQLLGKVRVYIILLTNLFMFLQCPTLLLLSSFLQIPPQFCSQQTAEEMALLAYNRALKLSRPGWPFEIKIMHLGSNLVKIW